VHRRCPGLDGVRVALIVVNWNNARQTLTCLDSVAALRTPVWRTFVVDNASTDGSAECIATRHPGAHVVTSAINRGYAGGFNLGRAEALRASASHVWLLNNDTLLDEYALTALLAADTRLGPAVLSPKILYTQRRDELWYAGGRLTWDLKTRHIGQGELDRGQHDQVRKLQWATGCSLFCSADVARRLGPMDERYFLYLEDVDWCLKARAVGVPLYFVPEARVYHAVSQTVARLTDGHLAYYAWRNHYLLATERGNFWLRTVARADLVWRLVKTALRRLCMPNTCREPVYAWRTRGLIDFARGRFGQVSA
jgi:GT2 family glycosyltransferase